MENKKNKAIKGDEVVLLIILLIYLLNRAINGVF